MKDSTIYFSMMSNVKNFNYLTAMVNRLDNSIITDMEAIELSIAEFLTSVRTWMVSQRETLARIKKISPLYGERRTLKEKIKDESQKLTKRVSKYN